ncbi:thiopurine S-methyltransferase [Halomonas halocynthiae]|uniref:thiopurine S-methyltransferase n=1 Tax=Halomonas halocynthiae TaxID=176290 RepID=UPI000402016B|nr:thiopurine S-methyltransferase [Halomonas halocynthiae]
MSDEWFKRWEEGRIGFHRTQVHPALVRYWPELQVPPTSGVLVPLCGKSLDMRWLAKQGYPVLGIELASQAIEQFLADGEGEISRYRHNSFDVSRQGSVELWCGDIFHFHIREAARVGAFYDRAALVALPEAARQRYAFHLAQLLPPGAKGLVVGLTRPAGDAGGPPYSVSHAEMEQLFAPNFRLEHLSDGAEEPGSGFREHVWSLVRRGPQQRAF